MNVDEEEIGRSISRLEREQSRPGLGKKKGGKAKMEKKEEQVSNENALTGEQEPKKTIFFRAVQSDENPVKPSKSKSLMPS